MHVIEIDRPLAGYLRRYHIETEDRAEDFTVYTRDLAAQLQTICQTLRNDLQSFKLHVRIKLKFNKILDAGTTSEAFFSNKQTTILTARNIETEINEIIHYISNKIEEFCENGSDWVISEIIGTDIHVARYQPLAAANSTFMKLPKGIANKRAVINVKNNDMQCFKWAVLSALHPQPPHQHAYRPQKYKPFENRYNFGAYEYPFKLTDIPKFEEDNNISIHVYGYEKTIYPLYAPKTCGSCSYTFTMIQLTSGTTVGSRT